MNRRELLAGLPVALGAGLSMAPASRLWAAPAPSTVRGVRIGLTTGSLNPLPDVPGKEMVDIVIDQCLQLGAGNVELAAGFFGPAVKGTVGGHMPAVITPEYTQSREAQRQWRLSPAAMDSYRAVRARFDAAGLNLFSLSNTFADDCTDAEMDAMFRQMQALKVMMFQTNQTRVPMGPRLAPFADKYGISPSFHTHAEVQDPNEIATPESLEKLLALSPNFRVCLDIGHFTAGDNDPVAYLREHHDKITHIHVKDRKKHGGPNVAWGTGDTPIRECLALIRDNRWPIIALTEREFKGTATPFEETRSNLDAMRAMLQA